MENRKVFNIDVGNMSSEEAIKLMKELKMDYCKRELIKPEAPLGRIIRYSLFTFADFCPKCHSSMERKYIFFGKVKCIHLKCGYEK